jgi:N-acetylmuramoyl-L-alanine amidase
MARKGEGVVRTLRAISALLLSTATALAVSCAHKPPEPSLVKLYERLHEPLDEVDLSGLKGRVIVIDPGHGGVFPGAVGVNGLREADVNLGVALYLWGLLEEAGAEVTLTRTVDKDFVGGDSLALRQDLAARVEMVREIRPDVFISLHHNAEAGGDSNYNEIQIYHKLGDRGPSLDLARLMARHLLINLGEPDCRVLPGNYFVLRNSPAPAVLCEPSYISNPAVESKLELALKQRLEAESYFLALVDYFSRGVPRLSALLPSGEVTESRPGITAVFDSVPLVDASTVRILLDGDDLAVTGRGPNVFMAFPPGPLAGGSHTLKASGRSIGGNACPEARSAFLVSLKPAIVNLAKVPGTLNPPYPRKVTALVEDAEGNPVADSTAVRFIWDGGSTEKPTRSGRASVFVGRDLGFDRTYVAAVCEGIPCDIKLDDKVDRGAISGFVEDAVDVPVGGAIVIEPESGVSVITDEHGFFSMTLPAATAGLEVSGRGYRKTYFRLKKGEVPVVALERVYRGLPDSLRVTVDPRGGGTETGWVGPTGTAAADLNLAVAAKLMHLFASAGVNAVSTRDSDRRVTPEERVEINESAHSDLFISIGHAPGARRGVVVGHYHNSSRGKELAGEIMKEYQRLFGSPASLKSTDDYVVQQTSCPAVNVLFTAPGTVGGEESQSETASIWKRAYALFCAVLAYAGIEEGDTFSIQAAVTANGQPAEGAILVLDGALELMTGPEGKADIICVERGEHTLEAFSTTGKSAPVVFNEETGYVELQLE